MIYVKLYGFNVRVYLFIIITLWKTMPGRVKQVPQDSTE